MRATSRLLPAALAFVLFSVPTGAGPAGAEELVGTAWSLKGSILARASGGGRSAVETGRVGPYRVEFPDEGVLRLVDTRWGDVTGTWEPHATKARRAVGELDEESLAGFLDDMERRTRRAVRRQAGVRVGVDLETTKTKFVGSLNRSGERLRARCTVRMRGRVTARGVRLRLRASFTVRLRGGQTDDV